MSEPSDHPSEEALAALAAELGLERLLALDRDAFAAALAAARGYARRIAAPERIHVEPSHVCSFAPPAPAGEEG